jgi:glycosyltransferase involved in cell wall biosynthesis
MSDNPKVAFGCTLLDKGLAGSGIDGIGHYCQEMLTEFSKNSDIQIAPFSFGLEHSNSGAKILPSYVSHLAKGLLKIESNISETTKFFNDVDIIHSTDQLIPIIANKPLITTVMDVIPLSHPEFIKSSSRVLKTEIWKRLIKRSDHIITISEFSKNEILKFTSYPEKKITPIPLGVDKRFFDKIPTEKIQYVLNKFSINKSFFLFIGSIQPRKNLLRLIHAHSALPKNYAQEFPLVIAGKIAWDDGYTLRAIKTAVLDKRCIWLNYINDFEKRSLLQATIGLTFTSLYEGFGLPILEAYASGAPVITSNNTSMPEIARNAAIFVDPRNPENIKDALLNLIEGSSVKKSLILEGFKISEQFSWSRTANSTVEIYSLFA